MANEQRIGPTLGRDAIRAGLTGAVVGIALVLVFMLLYYQGAGVIASIAVTLNVLLLVGILSMLEATLTLPGIAGIALTVGMAVDANVLINERIREELRLGKSPRAAVEERVIQGNPKEEIVRAAEEWPADLVVVGGRGLGGVRGFLLGSVSQTVARHVHCPVLVVKGRARPLASVLIATDGSDGANEAIRFLLSLPLVRNTKVRLLSAVESTPYPASAPKMIRAQLKGMIAQLERERRAEVEKVLDRAARELKAKVTRLTRSMPTGHPAREIVAAAASFDADLVVVGARGLGGMKRLLLGSVSERVLHDARRLLRSETFP
jgi:nucleotide-binding universal stress UspA family protein